VALPVAGLTWLLLGATRGAWAVDERWSSRWRWQLLTVAAVLGLFFFLSLPKTEIVRVTYPSISQE
jgi:hypothetical protein